MLSFLMKLYRGDRKTGSFFYSSHVHLQNLDNCGCGGFQGGLNATDYAVDGYFDNAAVTLWNRGTNAEVIWKIAQSATADHHRGGYAYRYGHTSHNLSSSGYIHTPLYTDYARLEVVESQR